MSRTSTYLTSLAGMALAAIVTACSGEGAVSPPVEAMGDEGSGAPESDPELHGSDPAPDEPTLTGGALQFSLDGREGPLMGQARVTIREDVDDVAVAITGSFGAEDFLQIQLELPQEESPIGEHHSDLGRPLAAEGDNVLNASLEGEQYYSRVGEVDFTLERDGHIEGTFTVSLASAEGLDLVNPVFEGEEVTTLDGAFSGSWALTCFSRLPGHQTWNLGGDYCEALEL